MNYRLQFARFVSFCFTTKKKKEKEAIQHKTFTRLRCLIMFVIWYPLNFDYLFIRIFLFTQRYTM